MSSQAWGQTLSDSSDANSLLDYLVGGGHLDDEENVTEVNFIRLPVNYVTVLRPEFESFQEII